MRFNGFNQQTTATDNPSPPIKLDFEILSISKIYK